MAITVRARAPFASRVDRSRLVRIARRALRMEKTAADLGIYITGDAEIRELNRRFHGRNRPTDVLSFPAGAWGYLGDVVISYERARTQARAAGWHIGDELELLVVHGVLHLLGYDDLSPRARRVMWQRQLTILGHPIKGEEQ